MNDLKEQYHETMPSKVFLQMKDLKFFLPILGGIFNNYIYTSTVVQV